MLQSILKGDKSAQNPDHNATHSSRPSVYFTEITFSDGSTIKLERNDVVVLVGPNNAGKSLALKELQTHLMGEYTGRVIKSAKFAKSGTLDELKALLEKHARRDHPTDYPFFEGYDFRIAEDRLGTLWNEDLGSLSKFFCLKLDTEDRILGSDPAPGFEVLTQAVSHPIHHLCLDETLEQQISAFFHRAFGLGLFVHRLDGRKIPLWVGSRFPPEHGENYFSLSYLRRLASASHPLHTEGDGMRSFATVLLHVVAPVNQTVLLLDEPEAFLHPPQCRLIGELISDQCESTRQLFVATHSPDVLNGLLSSNPANLHVLRIQRDGERNVVNILDKGIARSIALDPIMKYSSVVNAVFHERVIVCESDADCMFYSALLDCISISDSKRPDAQFIHGNGKHKLSHIVRSLCDLGVRYDVIVDMDVLNDINVIKRLSEAVDLNWSAIESDIKLVQSEVEKNKIAHRITKDMIFKYLAEVNDSDFVPENIKKNIVKELQKPSPWDTIKLAGESAIPPGKAMESYQRLRDTFTENGIWLVRVGELEGFYRSSSNHGSRWVQEVLTNVDLSNDPNLNEARLFIGEIWNAKREPMED